jgi:hypothetical protein
MESQSEAFSCLGCGFRRPARLGWQARAGLRGAAPPAPRAASLRTACRAGSASCAGPGTAAGLLGGNPGHRAQLFAGLLDPLWSQVGARRAD